MSYFLMRNRDQIKNNHLQIIHLTCRVRTKVFLNRFTKAQFQCHKAPVARKNHHILFSPFAILTWPEKKEISIYSCHFFWWRRFYCIFDTYLDQDFI